MQTLDNGKIIQIIDNRNYKNEPAFLFETYYCITSNPFKALISLIRHK